MGLTLVAGVARSLWEGHIITYCPLRVTEVNRWVWSVGVVNVCANVGVFRCSGLGPRVTMRGTMIWWRMSYCLRKGRRWTG